jgi:F0F1-type ATP synthase alpha subunit
LISTLVGISCCEYLREANKSSLIAFDNLSTHSKSYRQISLILGKIPSRDAFPADIFNLHSSLLERCGKVKSLLLGCSITGIPIIETLNSDITEFIATNLISITDGQFYISKELFLNSIRPAIELSLSVTRIGSNAQCKQVKVLTLIVKYILTFGQIFLFQLHLYVTRIY